MSQISRWPPGWQPQPKISQLDARPYFNRHSVSTAVFRELMDETRLFLVFKACLYKLNPRWFQRWQSHCNLTTGEISPQYGVLMRAKTEVFRPPLSRRSFAGIFFKIHDVVQVTRPGYLSHITTKPAKWHMRPAKTQISMCSSTQSDQSLRCANSG